MDNLDQSYPTTLQLLRELRLAEALQMMQVDIEEIQDWGLKDKLNEINVAYNYMLQYMEQGINDPQRENYYQSLLQNCYDLAEKLHFKKLTRLSSTFYFERIRYYQDHPLPTYEALKLILESCTEEMALASLSHKDNEEQRMEIRKKHERAYADLFHLTWTTMHWTTAEQQQVREIMQSVLISDFDKALLMSSVTMSLLQFFDIEKYYFIIEHTTFEEEEVKQRALVGFILVTYFSEDKIKQHPEVKKRLSLMLDQPDILEAMDRIQLQLLLCKETEKIDRKMREDIIPTLMKNADFAQMKMGLSDKDEELDMDEFNPEWQKSMEESGVTEKIEEMAKWQMEGADIYMGTFSQLKNYPFFHAMPNWFYPFDRNHSEVVSIFTSESEKEMLGLLLETNHFCNSDQYSFCKTYMNMPQAQRSMIQQQLDGQMEALKESQSERQKLSKSKAEQLSNRYIQDLYRFFKLFSRRTDFEDPFVHSLCLQKSSALAPFYDRKDFNELLAEFFFKKEYWTEAGDILARMAQQELVSAEVFQKIGFCRQKEKRYEEAVTHYEMADIQLSDNDWTLRHLATCYRRLQDYDKAIEYYKRALRLKEDNLSLIFHLANCYAASKRYDEAIPLYFKWEYLAQGNAKAWRAIAWCLLASHKLEEALKYYNKIFEQSTPTLQDCLNRGHAFYLLGQLPTAIQDYKRCHTACKSTNQFVELMRNDSSLLFKDQKKAIELALLIDLTIKER